MKKVLVLLFCMVFLLSFISAQNYKLEISPTKDIFEAGEKIVFKISLLDSNNNPIKDQISVAIQDSLERVDLENTYSSNEIIEIDLGPTASYGRGTITAMYKNTTATGFFEININEKAKFELNKENLIITNIGNTQYSKPVHILIGNTKGTKYPKLSLGESIKFKLVAPEGVYNIKVNDDITTETWGEIKLTGTGKVIGAIDQTSSERTPLTGGIRPDEDSDEGLLSYMKDSKFTYVFIFVIFGAMILLAIERRFKKKI